MPQSCVIAACGTRSFNWPINAAGTALPDNTIRRSDSRFCESKAPLFRQAIICAGAAKSDVGFACEISAPSAGGVNAGSSRVAAPPHSARCKLYKPYR